jgi:hypothetical protein
MLTNKLGAAQKAAYIMLGIVLKPSISVLNNPLFLFVEHRLFVLHSIQSKS